MILVIVKDGKNNWEIIKLFYSPNLQRNIHFHDFWKKYHIIHLFYSNMLWKTYWSIF